MKKRKHINLDSKVLFKKLKEINHDLDVLFSEEHKFAKQRTISIEHQNKIIREISTIESNIYFTPLKVEIEDVKNLYHLYDEQKILEKTTNSIEKKLFDINVRVDKKIKQRINLLLPSELLEDIENRVKRTSNPEKNMDEDLRKDPVLFRVVSEIDFDIANMKRHNPHLNRRQIARCILNKFTLYKKLMNSTPYPIKIKKNIYFEVVAPKVKIVQNNRLDPKQLYGDATRRQS